MISPILKLKSSFSLLFHLQDSLTTLSDSLVFASLTICHGDTYGSMWLFIYFEVAYTILVPQIEEEEEDNKWNSMLYLPPSNRVFCYNVVWHFKRNTNSKY